MARSPAFATPSYCQLLASKQRRSTHDWGLSVRVISGLPRLAPICAACRAKLGGTIRPPLSAIAGGLYFLFTLIAVSTGRLHGAELVVTGFLLLMALGNGIVMLGLSQGVEVLLVLEERSRK